MDDSFTWTDKARRTVRDYLAVGFRHRGLMIGCSISVVVITVAATLLLPKYEVTSKILVDRNRQDPVVTTVGDQTTSAQFGRDITEAELNAELDMLSGKDLLEKVVKDCNLQDDVWTFFPFTVPMPIYPAPAGSDPHVAMAVKHLSKGLNIETTTGATVSNTIDISYKSHRPEKAYCVLSSLNKHYLELHLAVHRPSGELAFFSREAETYRQSLARTEDLLAKFPHEHGAVSAPLEKEIALQRLNDFKASLQQTRAKIANTEERVRFLMSRNAENPTRMVTEMKVADNPDLQQKLRTTLLDLELKRIDLVAKFQPDYRLVKDVDTQIAETRAAIEAMDKAAVKEQTTDLDPAHEWMRSELAKAETALRDLQAEAEADSKIVFQYQSEAAKLNAAGLLQQDLLREAKAEEESYLLYRRKREEARISDALDRHRLANVSVAEQPILPTIPDHNPLLYGMVVFMASTLLSLGMIVGVEYVKPAFHTPDELEAMLNLPVLAAVPFAFNSTHDGNGKGNGYKNGFKRNGNVQPTNGAQTGTETSNSVLKL